LSFKYTSRHHRWYAAQVPHGTTYVVLTLSLLIRPVWPRTYDELVSLSKKKVSPSGHCPCHSTREEASRTGDAITGIWFRAHMTQQFCVAYTDLGGIEPVGISTVAVPHRDSHCQRRRWPATHGYIRDDTGCHHRRRGGGANMHKRHDFFPHTLFPSHPPSLSPSAALLCDACGVGVIPPV
jgi:hypothetical protein